MMGAANGGPEIVLDLSRLLSRVLHPTPTGVDRCEMAYARGLLVAAPKRLHFAAVHPLGVYGRLPRDAVLRFLDATEARWENGGATSAWALRRDAAGTLAALRPRLAVHRDGRPRVYIKASPNNLSRPELVRSILCRERSRFVCLLHDLIPLQYPEYARPDGAALHLRRVQTMVELADGIIANSQATLNALQPFLSRVGKQPATTVAHLGVEIRPAARPTRPAGGRPYFVCIGTIEPRKNHLLLLNLWRRMVEERGSEACPRLLLIGRRGWENEQVVDMLDRCPALVGCVEELGTLADREAQALLAGAAALLLPSFAEGYGMPVAEALSLGVPVICSDLLALREVGSDIPDFLDPLDGSSWARQIQDYSDPQSPGRARQLRALAGWTPLEWQGHLERLLGLIETI